MKIGTLDINNLYVGGSQASAAYLGSTQVYPSQPTGQPANEIWYTTEEGTSTLSDALQVAASGFNPSLGNSIVSDTIVDGVGKMVFTNPVTAIPDHAFGDYALANYYNYSITLPEGVTTIGAEAFEGMSLSGLSLPSTITSIGDYVFYEGFTEDGSINYAGSVNDWDDISFGESWFGGESNVCVITCIDGEVDYCS